MSSMARRFVAAAFVAQLVCAATLLGDITGASLQIQGVALEVETISVTTAIDVPTTLQTKFGGKKNDEAAAVEGLLAVGELTGPGLDAPIQLTTAPGHRFQVPGLSVEGVYYLQNIRLMNGTQFVAPASPSTAAITVANVLQTSVRVRQLTPEELRSRGIVVDGRNFDVYEYTFSFLIDGKVVEIAFPVMIDPRTHEVTPIAREQPFGLPPVTATQPPRWTPPQVIAFEMPPEPPDEGLPGEDQIEKNPTRTRPSIPAAIVIPNSFAVLHQFKTGSSENPAIDANGGLVRQMIHGGMGYDDPLEIAVADRTSGGVTRLYPIFDEAASGTLQAVLNASGELLSRTLFEGAYGEDEFVINGPAIDNIALKAKKNAKGDLEQIVVTMRSTEEITATSVSQGSRLAAVTAAGEIAAITNATPTQTDDFTISWTLDAAEWATLTAATNANGLSIAATNQLRARAWSSSTTVLPPPSWMLNTKPVFTTSSVPIEYRESFASTNTWLSTIKPDEEKTVTVYSIGRLTAIAEPANSPNGPARPVRLITSSAFHGYPFMEPVTGMMFARARWYDPFTGSFLTPDPVGYRDSSNLYAFAGGDPVNGRDPRGEQDEGGQGFLDGIGAALKERMQGAARCTGLFLNYAWYQATGDRASSGAAGAYKPECVYPVVDAIHDPVEKIGGGAERYRAGVVQAHRDGDRREVARLAMHAAVDLFAMYAAGRGIARAGMPPPPPTPALALNTGRAMPAGVLPTASTFPTVPTVVMAESSGGGRRWQQYERKHGGQQTPMEIEHEGKRQKVRLDRPPTDDTVIDFKDYNWLNPSYEKEFLRGKVIKEFTSQIRKYQNIRPGVHLQFSQQPPQWIVLEIEKAGGTYSVVP